jgi:hypothetical protein
MRRQPKAKAMVFVVPFFLRGGLTQMRVYSDAKIAQRALRRYVGPWSGE